MAEITIQCKGCQAPFAIAERDQAFYERMKAPPPNYCPQCRMMRRMAHRNERTLYRRACDLCRKDGVSIYPAQTPWPVYCAPCWWGDGWDPKSFGMVYDPNRPFLDQFKELQMKVPRIALLSITNVNSEYVNNSADNKNSYLIFAAELNEDCYYGRLVQRCKSVVDGTFVYDCERCYEVVDCRNCFNCLYSERCQKSSDLLFCFDLRDCQNCILSVNLRHKQYCIENQQCTKEEYEKKKKEILASRTSVAAARRRYEELRGSALVKYSFSTKCNDATGDYLFNCHESRRLFDIGDAKNCAYLADGEQTIDCWDGNNMYYNPQLSLDVMGVMQPYNVRYSTYAMYCSNCEYTDNCHHADECFGCIGTRKSKYSILNKEYSKEEYEKLKAQIVESMKKDGSYGDMIPPSLSPFGYNETLAKDYFPLTKEQALALGFRWQDNAGSVMTGKETIKKGEVPSTIDEVTDVVLKDIFACEDCGKNFRLTPGELQFYKMVHVPLPTKDFECRHRDRMAKRTPRNLWRRQCQCQHGSGHRNQTQHFHGDAPCSNEFETAYAPDRKEVIYCEACYQSEVA
jgi:hypothetical protein